MTGDRSIGQYRASRSFSSNVSLSIVSVWIWKDQRKNVNGLHQMFSPRPAVEWGDLVDQVGPAKDCPPAVARSRLRCGRSEILARGSFPALLAGLDQRCPEQEEAGLADPGQPEMP